MVSSFVMVECMMPENLQSECDNLNMFTDKKEWNSWGCTSTKVCVALLLFLWFTINDRRSISDKNGQWPSRQHVELTAEPFELTVSLESSKPRKQRKRRKPWCSKISIFANLHRSKNHSTSSSFQVFPGLSRSFQVPGLSRASVFAFPSMHMQISNLDMWQCQVSMSHVWHHWTLTLWCSAFVKCCMNWAPWHLQQTVLLDILFKMNAKKPCSCDIVLNNVHDNTFLLHKFDCRSQLPPRWNMLRMNLVMQLHLSTLEQ